MLRIYGSAKSRTLRTLWMVGELGLDYEHKDYLPHAPETQTPEFQALNSNKRIPTIDDDGFVPVRVDGYQLLSRKKAW